MEWLNAEPPVVLARHTGPRGEVVLRRRDGRRRPILELVINGAFAMDSDQTSSEQALGDLAGQPGTRDVLVGGLGLGYTAAAVAVHPVRRIDVVDIEECLVRWARRGLTTTWAALSADHRVRWHAADVAAVLRDGLPDQARWDLIVLDVDNGPDFLIHDDNARLYEDDLLSSAAGRLRPGGRLAIWCQGPSPALAAALHRRPGSVHHQIHPVRRGQRTFAYAVYVLTAPLVPSTRGAPGSTTS